METQGNTGSEISLNHQEQIITFAFESDKCKCQQIFTEHLLCADHLLCIPRPEQDPAVPSGALLVVGASGQESRPVLRAV